MSHLAALISETASTQQAIDAAIDAGMAKGLFMPERVGDPWRALAACWREFTVLEGKAAILDQLMREQVEASECRRRWDELEAKRLEGSTFDAITG